MIVVKASYLLSWDNVIVYSYLLYLHSFLIFILVYSRIFFCVHS